MASVDAPGAGGSRGARLRLVAEEGRDPRILLQPGQIRFRGQLRLVARGIHHAEEAQRLAPGGAKLVPGHRRHGDEIAGLDRLYFTADEAVAAPAQDQHGVHVLVAFKGREAARRHLEVAQLPVHLWIGEQHLPGDGLEQGAVVFLVRKLVHAFPAVFLRLAMDRSLVARHDLNSYGRPSRAHPYANSCTFATNAAVASVRRSRASSKAPPISSITSAP